MIPDVYVLVGGGGDDNDDDECTAVPSPTVVPAHFADTTDCPLCHFSSNADISVAASHASSSSSVQCARADVLKWRQPTLTTPVFRHHASLASTHEPFLFM